MAHVGTDSPLSAGAARTGRLRVECSRDGQTRLFMRFRADSYIVKIESQQWKTLIIAEYQIARKKNSANSRHSNVERGLVLVVGIEPTFSYGLTAKKGRGDYYPLVSEPFIQPFFRRGRDASDSAKKTIASVRLIFS